MNICNRPTNIFTASIRCFIRFSSNNGYTLVETKERERLPERSGGGENRPNEATQSRVAFYLGEQCTSRIRAVKTAK